MQPDDGSGKDLEEKEVSRDIGPALCFPMGIALDNRRMKSFDVEQGGAEHH